MEGPALARWARRHPEGERLRAAMQANDIALEAVIARVKEADPRATLADVRAAIRRAKEAA